MKGFISIKFQRSRIDDFTYINEISDELLLELQKLITLEGGSTSDLNIFFSVNSDELILSFTHEKSEITNPDGIL